MPQLKHLNDETCPHCHAPVTTIHFQGRIHTNGEQFEKITFECGGSKEWVPDFSHEREIYPCGKTPIPYRIQANPIQQTADFLRIPEAEVLTAIQTGTLTIKPDQYETLKQLGWVIKNPHQTYLMGRW